MLSLGPLALTAPWVLLAAAALPLLWWLMRATPPAPRRMDFPAVRLLFGLRADQHVSVHTPWWLILMRLVLALLVILALSGPLLNPDATSRGDGPLVLVVDDTWAAAPTWDERRSVLLDLASRAGRESRPVLLVPTAAPAPGAAPPALDPVPASDAATALRALEPRPWGKDLAALDPALETTLPDEGSAVWVHDGLDAPGTDAFAARLRAMGRLEVRRSGPGAVPLILRPPETAATAATALTVTVARPASDRLPERPLTVRARDGEGRVAVATPATLPQGALETRVTLDVPAELAPDLTRVDIADQAGAGAVALLDDRWRRRPVGLVTGAVEERAPVPLLDETHYIREALAPVADLREGAPGDLLQRDLAVMLMTDGARPDAAAVTALIDWVRRGGTLVRFAGPRLEPLAPELLPVRLRPGERAMGGSLSWSAPARLAPFPEDGPFAGLTPPDDVTVRRQVLAEPAPDLSARTWARLSDGTPLVTGAPLGQGRVVLVHVTADPRWSSLAMSGLFVDMLTRLVDGSRGVAGAATEADEGAAVAGLPPLRVLDGRGRLGDPAPGTQPLPLARLDAPEVDPAHPPGLYGADGPARAYNLGPALGTPQTLGALPSGVIDGALDTAAAERDLKPPLLTAALILALVDLVVGLAMRGLLAPSGWTRPGRGPAAGAGALLLAGLLMLAPRPGLAQDSAPANPAPDATMDPTALAAALQTRLAWVETGDPETDRISAAGLTALTRVLARRTSAELAPPAGVSLSSAPLAVFPLLYWPVTASQPPVTATERTRVNAYLHHGGMLLLDVHDGGDPGRVLKGVDVPALRPLPEDHVLTRSFYLLDRFPGRTDGDTVWVEADPITHDNVSSVVVGYHDWAGAWATDEAGRALFATVPGGNRQREMAYRFGVNVVLYALTGNYKGDQVHLPAIMERLTN
ncbi:DUF4159 domain-containing protein [Roseospira marina]|uniref:DUF4159 domain-containing protein n=1 Tax=Roseospira marina TaxID=140057 RepID=A0A5M6IAC4_9PROT|nr:DUF4159 domain-containing protein [Roseospira marina]KAA5605226.1 DUF4159 domain-containing protein [Roseospira marina]MBB4314682.1 hypothetical protein [Roseospira marina]MBB5087671.1 hypothetical protein [Roseospira marina]